MGSSDETAAQRNRKTESHIFKTSTLHIKIHNIQTGICNGKGNLLAGRSQTSAPATSDTSNGISFTEKKSKRKNDMVRILRHGGYDRPTVDGSQLRNEACSDTSGSAWISPPCM